MISRTEETIHSNRASRASALPLVAISVLNWNGWQDTLECLESVRRLEYPSYLTVVVDNGSTNGSADKIKAWAEENLGPGHVLADYTRETALAGGIPETEQALDRMVSPNRLVLIRNKENLGFTGGNNVSIHYALTRANQVSYVFLLNNDAHVSSNCLCNLLRAIQEAKAGIAQATILSGHNSTWQPSTPVRPLWWQITVDRLFGHEGPLTSEKGYGATIVASGAAVLISRRVLREIFARQREYLHQGFFMYQEDCGMSLRARKLGFRCVHADNAAVWHRGAGTAGGRYNPLEYYYTHRNRLLLSSEAFAGGKLYAHLNTLKALGRVVKCLLHGRPRAARAIACGVIDGYCGVTGKWKCHDNELALHGPR